MTHKQYREKILIIDFGSQVTQLIARRIREIGVYCEIQPFHKISKSSIKKLNPIGIILSGGPDSVHKNETPKVPTSLFNLGIPILGICYGQQTLVAQLGGRVVASESREFGRAMLKVTDQCVLHDGVWSIGNHYPVWMSHGDRVISLPDGFRVTAITDGSPFAIIANDSEKIFGVQFHPEVIHTEDGVKLLKNFVHKVCQARGNWTMAKFKETAIREIQAKVKSENVICGLSGGIDSSVVSLLLHEAIGNQLTCVFIDNGLLRKNESNEVISLFSRHYNINLVHKNASELFLSAPRGIEDPEQKRKIIGKIFIQTFEKEAKKIGGVKFLAQGTLYPDIIESISFAGGPSVTIKSHHNVGGLPKHMNLTLIEPLRELFKDEVRNLGHELGLPNEFILRHPFPGPGLAIRIPGSITKEKIEILKDADDIYLQEIRSNNLYKHIWQAFAVLLPVQTVGVMGDQRTYEFVCALRAVTSTDGMTADYYPFDHNFLSKTARRIINEVPGINRVVYDITSKPPGTIEWE